MRIQAGSPVINVQLPAIDGSDFDLSSISGRPFMLSFFRFATCPFCNMRMHQLVSRFEEFGEDFTIVAVFDSPLENLTRYASDHQAPFPILADADNRYYREYSIEHSVPGMLKGIFGRMPTMIKGLMRGYIPFPIKGRLTTMPADFLVDRQGIIQTAYYGKDEGDHLPFEDVQLFAGQV